MTGDGPVLRPRHHAPVLGLSWALAMAGGAAADRTAPLQALSFAELDGWAAEDHAASLAAFRATCAAARFPGTSPPGWAALCAAAWAATDGRAFFEAAFRPVLHGDPPALITAYYEPVLDGARAPGGRFTVPLYGVPDDLAARQPYFTRAEIGAGALAGRGLELAWVADPVEAFFLQVQGSGRIRLSDGSLLRLGYDGKNGHPYRSIGRLLVDRGEMAVETATADAIRAWLRADPVRGGALMDENPSFVFFREIAGLPCEAGPRGTLGVPLTTWRSLAVDPDIYALGLPVWVEADIPGGKLRRLMQAEDTGGAIRGAQRADLFIGIGAAAGRAAGAVRARGRLVALVPAGALP